MARDAAWGSRARPAPASSELGPGRLALGDQLSASRAESESRDNSSEIEERVGGAGTARKGSVIAERSHPRRCYDRGLAGTRRLTFPSVVSLAESSWSKSV